MAEQPVQRRVRPAPADKAIREPWNPQECATEDVGALRAVYRGDAPEHLQRRAMDFIIKTLCGVGRNPFVPGGEDGRRATDLAIGKQQVGLEILNLVATKTQQRGEQG